jgi:hypothetical protein
MREELLRFDGAQERDPAIDAWMDAHGGELGDLAREWFEVMRKCGDEVRELLHDGCPTACLGDAAFGYVNVFSSHVNVGFFHGAALADPARLLQGEGKRMRHVKLRPGMVLDAEALSRLIEAAYSDIKRRHLQWGGRSREARTDVLLPTLPRLRWRKDGDPQG